MTTSLSDRRALIGTFALTLGLPASLAAQEVQLPSGHAATLYDVVLEASAGVLGPGVEVDGDEADESDLLDDEPLDSAPDGMEPTASGDATTGGLARFRLLLPGLGGEGATYEDVVADFPWLCERLALPALAANGWSANEIIIALSDREVSFGVIDQEAVQYFEGFRIADGACIAQVF